MLQEHNTGEYHKNKINHLSKMVIIKDNKDNYVHKYNIIVYHFLFHFERFLNSLVKTLVSLKAAFQRNWLRTQ